MKTCSRGPGLAAGLGGGVWRPVLRKDAIRLPSVHRPRSFLVAVLDASVLSALQVRTRMAKAAETPGTYLMERVNLRHAVAGTRSVKPSRSCVSRTTM